MELNTKETLDFIKKAHKGQFYGNKPYWTHPKDVADRGKKTFGSKFSEDAINAALLHDVVEDTVYSVEDLKDMGYNKAVYDAVALLTKEKGLPYEKNIQRIINSGNKIAMMVKYCDNYVNFHGDKSDWDETKRVKSQEKYAKSLNTLGKKLGVRADFSPF